MPGDYLIGSREGTVAVCTLASQDLPAMILALGDPSLALVGKCATENIGIEKILWNIIATPSIRWLILCGEEARGHRPGDAMLKLKEHGVDPAMRIQGASSPRPILKNLTLKEVARFRRQVTILDRIGNSDPISLGKDLRACASRPTDPLEEYQSESLLSEVPRIEAHAPARLQLDPTGFFIVLLDRAREVLICEHYTNDGKISHVIEGRQASLVAATVIEQGLVSRLDHAAYLGRELARAELALRSGAPYRQDVALGALGEEGPGPASDCAES